jgi:hypothetical protein
MLASGMRRKGPANAASSIALGRLDAAMRSIGALGKNFSVPGGPADQTLRSQPFSAIFRFAARFAKC